MADHPADWKHFVEQAALSDVGLRRSNNQDSYAVVLAGDEGEFFRKGHLFMVADGMGAHAAGELASKLACNGVPHTYHKLADRPPHEALRQAIIETNAHVHGRGQANPEFHGMGTTTSVLLILPQGAVVGHVGDSRVYRLRNHRLEQLSFDHSLVWEMKAAGQLPEGSGANLVPKNIITRSLGPHAEVKVDLEGPFPLEVGDTFMMCSDGLSGPVTDEDIGVILGTLSPAEAVRVLVDLANLRGGPDNITTIVVKIVQPLVASKDPRSMMTGGESAGAVHPALWIVMGVCLLAAGVMAFMGQLVPAGVSALGAVAAGAVGMFQRFSGGGSPSTGLPAGPFGKGPHTSRQSVPNREEVARFAQIAQRLRDAASDEQWSVDWSKFNAFTERAAAANQREEFAAAAREYALGISFMMNEIRHQRGKKNLKDSQVIDM